jgi:UDP-N-acetyl-D-glucosamine dehydrogenase
MINSYQVVKNKIDSKQAKICVVGLGYVGLPLVVSLVNKGYYVYGFDTNRRRIQRLKRGIGYIVDIDPVQIKSFITKDRFKPTSSQKVLTRADIIIVCVPTPLRKVKIPDISYVLKASKTIAECLRPNQLVILESTSFPTTTKEKVLPILRRSKLKIDKDFFLCFSPERVNPGDKKYPVTKIPKVVGGVSKKSGRLAKVLYGKIINKVITVSTAEVAETSKLLENTFRMVNIALANEFAMLCHKLDIDIWEVIKAAKTKPFGFMPFYPGPGVGGHCIPADPIYLSWKAKRIGFKTKMIDLASLVNHSMPEYIIKRLKEILKARGVSWAEAKILVVGVTYKKDVKDLRESPALEVIQGLRREKIKVDYYDPLIKRLDIGNIKSSSIKLRPAKVKSYHCLLIITAHSSIDYQMLRQQAQFIFDTRNIYKKDYSNVIRL